MVNQAPGYLFVDLVRAAHNYNNKICIVVGEIPDGIPDGVEIKLLNPYNRNGNFNRFSSWIMFTIRSSLYIFFRRKSISSILCVTNPPLMLTVLPFFNIPYSILLYDMYPQILAATNIIDSKSLMYRLLRKISCRAYRRSQCVFTLSHTMLSELNNQCECSCRARVVPLWHNVKEEQVSLEPKTNVFENFGISASFIVIYAGNFGSTHPLEDLVGASDFLLDESIHILLVGGGAKEKLLKKQSIHRANVTILPFQNESSFVDLLRSANVAVVCLDSKSSTYSVPSKTFNAMAYGKPILLIASRDADISRLVNNNDVGIVIEPGNPRKVASSILKFKKDKAFRVRLSSNSSSLSDNFTKKNADLIINDWLS